MNRVRTGKIYVTLLFVYIFWKADPSENFKASLEEIIVMRSEKMKGNTCVKKFVFLKLAGLHLATSLTNNFPGFWLNKHLPMATSSSYTKCLKGTCEIVIVYSG